MRVFVAAIAALSVAACSTTKLQVAVDPASVADAGKLDSDKAACRQIALDYDLTGRKVAVGATGAVMAGGVTAGVATVVAGAVFLPALPFILGAAALGGGVGGGMTGMKEKDAREKIYAECLRGRGYTAFTAK